MGNSGSAHNLHSDCVESELNSYYTQQHLRQTTGERKKKYSQVVLGGWSSGRNIADYKVLPKPTENLKLRATTNGAILQAGGTISFRAKEQVDLEHKTEPNSFHPMRRCHTLILDGHIDPLSHRKSAPPLPEFRRSQTLLHVGYHRTPASQHNTKANFEGSTQPSAQNTPTTFTPKVNKYNKKRKAPPAPTKLSLKAENIIASQTFLSGEIKNQSLAKPRIYTTNSSKATVVQKQQLPIIEVAPFQRDSNIRTSIKSSRVIHETSPPGPTKLPYRREKSFDVKLLRQRETNDFNDKRSSTQTDREPSAPQNVSKLEDKLDCNGHGNGRKPLTSQQSNTKVNKSSAVFGATYPSELNYPRDEHKDEKPLSSLKIDSKNNNNVKEDSTLTNERKAKHQQSRIPQLKRTFYFGMESSSKSQNQNFTSSLRAPGRSEKIYKENEDTLVLSHSIKDEEEIIDNGILVHVRPTLPRRQPETPSFSPTAAWRNLVEEEQRLQLDRSRATQNIANSRIIETPISLASHTKGNFIKANSNWTPQQDLDDDDDEYEITEEQKCKTKNSKEKTDKDLENNSNFLHIFSLSLPRDVHLQCQMKPSLNYTEQENGLKAANCWLVPGFNSLQKFKTHLGKNTDIRSNTRCTCSINSTTKYNTYQLQNIFGDSFAVDSKSNHRPDCELNKASSNQTSYQNDNWLLHKSQPNNTLTGESSKILDDGYLKTSSNALPIINLQPKSLTNICGGKHIVYLPGQQTFKTSNKDSQKSSNKISTSKSNYIRPRQRQEIVRESLQDLTPIQNIHQSNVIAMEKNAHRFSFQSTVRVLEKRRLAEKLSRDAEIQEAQRLNELEAMKRVEEDFQRKRAPEKANLRNQLRLHLKANTENEEYRSLPLNIIEKDKTQIKHENRHISDVNNNIFCRAEPDGAVSPTLDFNDNLSKMRHSSFPISSAITTNELQCFELDVEESESEIQLPDLQCTALLIEPYLHSIV